MLVEAGILTLLALAAYRASKPGPGVMTPKRRMVFRHALNKVDPPLTPEQLCDLADVFDREGLPAYADILRKRAAMRGQPEELKKAHRSAYRKAMASQDPLSVRVLANAFEGQGKTAIAASLRNYADGLDAAVALSAITPPAGPPVNPSAVSVTAPPSVTTQSVGAPATSAAPENAPVPGSITAEPSADNSNPPAVSPPSDAEFTGFGGPSTVVIAATAPSTGSTTPADQPRPGSNVQTGGAAAFVQPSTSATSDPAAELGLSPEQYASFLAGTT